MTLSKSTIIPLPKTDSGVLEQTPFTQSFARHFMRNEPTTSSAIMALKRHALACLEEKGLPTRRNEAWKYLTLSSLLQQNFEPFLTSDVSSGVNQHFLPEADGLRVVFVNGRWRTELSDISKLPSGMILCDLQTALKDHAALVEAYLLQASSSQAMDPQNDLHGEDAFTLLNTAAIDTASGLFLYVPESLQVSLPFQMLDVYTSQQNPQAAHSRYIFALQAGSRLEAVVQSIQMGSDFQKKQALTFRNIVQDVFLQEKASFDLSWIESESLASMTFTNTRGFLGQSSTFSLNHVDLNTNASVNRHAAYVYFSAESATCILNGLNLLKGKSAVFHHTVMDHALPNNYSQQLYKSILDDQARCEYSGTVKVAPNANGTDSHQLTKNLLLSEDARALARPQLQILADDVKCNHGATVGQLEPSQLFYLQSRGLSPELAEALLTYGFAEEMILRLPVAGLRALLDQQVLGQFRQSHLSGLEL